VWLTNSGKKAWRRSLGAAWRGDGVGESARRCAMKCSKCGQEMELEEKDTSSGRDVRTYICRPCKERVDVDNGVALWKVLHDAREKEKGSG
jgi:DNA-directed RNA polymerase subunit RPC12/RpoP